MLKPIALIDCNNFYSACKRLFQQQVRRAPVVILSNNDVCVIARSNEANDLGEQL
jgi:DNA polymerase V